jgi:hypothetical protein
VPLSQAALSAGLLLLGAALTFAAARYWFLRNAAVAEAERIRGEHDRLVARVYELERDSAVVKAAVVPITTAFQALLVKELTHFHTPIMDALLVKVGPPNVLTPAEELQLAALLDERARDMALSIPDSEREAAHILPCVMRRAREEQVAVEKGGVLAVVSVPKDKADVLPGRREADRLLKP